MTDHPHVSSAPAQAGFADAVVLGFAAYLVFPILAVITAAFGAILLARGSVVAGVVFFGLMQLWVVGGLLTHLARRRRLQAAAAEVAATDTAGSDGTAAEDNAPEGR